ncbi:hypothetical protein BC832DRAFT_562064 [Gaertneriomyces semiglobifer]|nr:hypothetical protein BC832DRAFT_562064 [Gaertneriomyces semiglobifer]
MGIGEPHHVGQDQQDMELIQVPREEHLESQAPPSRRRWADRLLFWRKSAVVDYRFTFPAPETHYEFKSNYIRTTKFTLWSFLPVNLFYQFRRFYNIYFLLGALSVTAGVSSFSPVSQILPLIVVLFFSMAKEAYEDYNRYKSDKANNEETCTVIRGGQKVQIKSQHVGAGEVIYIEKGERSVVDAVVLAVCGEVTEKRLREECFIETSQLDGETNLKRRAPVTGLPIENREDADRFCSSIRGQLQCDPPNNNLNTYTGLLTIYSAVEAPHQEPLLIPLNMQNLILRATTLRNTPAIYALSTYVGSSTKVIQNLKPPKQKRSTLEQGLNTIVLIALFWNIVLLVSSVLLEYGIHQRILRSERELRISNPDDYALYWYLGPELDTSGKHALLTILSFFALYTYVIPISLFVTIEIVRVIQAKYMEWDRAMYTFRTSNTPPVSSKSQTSLNVSPIEKIRCRVNNSNLNEDLGVVEYVFSDKTGTLTCNEMVVKGWWIINDAGDSSSEIGTSVGEKEAGSCVQTLSGVSKPLLFCLNVALNHGVIPSLVQPSPASDVRLDVDSPRQKLPSLKNKLRPRSRNSFKATGSKNGSRHGSKDDIRKTSKGPDTSQQIIYESQSPDESALLEAIASSGFTLLSREMGILQIGIKLPHVLPSEAEEIWNFRVLNTLEFTSDRKRMSVLVQRVLSGQNGRPALDEQPIYMLTKGADNIVLGLLGNKTSSNTVKDCEAALSAYARKGLRTLVVGYREISRAEYETFSQDYARASRSLVDREKALADAAATIERDLTLLGCTAIEDRLQDEVPETIEWLLDAGVKVWLLTGDKTETAVEIGKSCGLLRESMSLVVIEATDAEGVRARLQEVLEICERERLGSGLTEKALIISGATLGIIFDKGNKELTRMLLRLTTTETRVMTVICTRTTPLQKSLVVQLIRKNAQSQRPSWDTYWIGRMVGKVFRSKPRRPVCLAIGDGANDVSMIQAASVGVGIKGREGGQAFRNSDYGIGEFRHLRRLMAVHGRWSRMRISAVVFFSFWKNLTLIGVQWAFGFENLWSGGLVYEELFLTAYNIVLTSVPPLILAIFDRDLPDHLLNAPKLYTTIMRKPLYWSPRRLTAVFFSSICSCAAIFLLVREFTYDRIITSEGRDPGYWVQTYHFSTVLLVIVMMEYLMVSKTWFWWTGAAIAISLAVNVIMMFIVQAIEWVAPGTALITYRLPLFWVVCVACIAGHTVVIGFFEYLRKQFSPTSAELLLERGYAASKSRKTEPQPRALEAAKSS